MKNVFAILLASAALTGTAFAQDAQASAITPEQIAALQAQIEALQAQVKQLQATQEAAAKPAKPATEVVWKGAPQLVDKEGGWSFKPRGRLQYDVAHVSHPGSYQNPGLGFSNRLRRARLGVEGSMPGGFGYKVEADFAKGDVEFADALLSYSTGPLELTIGQHNNFQSLEELTSSLHTSFIERAAFTDAFGFERRIGASAQYQKGTVLAQVGAFTDSIADINTIGDRNNSYSLDGRLVLMPKVGRTQLHFGASGHFRDLNDSASSVRYRQRPAVATTDVRFVNTGNIVNAKSETGYGLEAAAITGPFYAAGEVYWQTVGRDGFEDPTFFGAYADVGYFFTGESRGYKNGRFDRVKVRKPFDKGGWGSLGANLRWDYLDLNDSGIVGGRQNAYQASLNWKPMDYLLFGLNFARIVYRDAAVAIPTNDRDYGVNTVALRSQIDF